MPLTLTRDAAGRIAVAEGKTLEYKRDLSSPIKVLRTIAAFANSAGGRLVIGVEDDGTVVGVADPLAEEERLSSLISDSISPRLVPGVSIVTLDGKTLLVIDVPLSTQRPHYLARKGLESGTYVRLGSTNRQADTGIIADIERSVRGISFESLPEPRATLDDLDLATLPLIDGQAVQEAELVPLGLALRDGDTLVPTNAGILAACPHPDRFMPSAWVQCGRIRGKNRTDIFDRVEFHGQLLRAPEIILEFLRKHAYLSAEFGQIKRRDVLSIPLDPIREIVVNAIVHANYAEQSTPIRVAFYDDCIQIEGPGLLVAGMTVQDMRLSSRLRNPSLARIFRAAGLMENFGTGVRRVYEQLSELGLPEPSIEEIMDRVRVTVHIRDHAVMSEPDQDLSYLSATSSNQGTVSSNQDKILNRDAARILALAAKNSATRAEVFATLGLSNQTVNFRRHIEPLLAAGLLARTIPDRPTSRHQRYVTTDAGRQLLEGSES